MNRSTYLDVILHEHYVPGQPPEPYRISMSLVNGRLKVTEPDFRSSQECEIGQKVCRHDKSRELLHLALLMKLGVNMYLDNL